MIFLGSNAKIDLVDSDKWLKRHTENWPFSVHILADTPRENALEIINQV